MYVKCAIQMLLIILIKLTGLDLLYESPFERVGMFSILFMFEFQF